MLRGFNEQVHNGPPSPSAAFSNLFPNCCYPARAGWCGRLVVTWHRMLTITLTRPVIIVTSPPPSPPARPTYRPTLGYWPTGAGSRLAPLLLTQDKLAPNIKIIRQSTTLVY